MAKKQSKHALAQSVAAISSHPGAAEVKAFLAGKDPDYAAFLVDCVSQRLQALEDAGGDETNQDYIDNVGDIMFSTALALAFGNYPESAGDDLQWLDDAMSAIRADHKETVRQAFAEVGQEVSDERYDELDALLMAGLDDD